MLNYLYSHYTQAFSAPDKASVNASGGVGLWEFPKSTHYAFNPHKVRYTRWLFYVAGSYEPTDRVAPIPVTIVDDQTIGVSDAPSVDLYVTCYVKKTLGGTIMWDFQVVKIAAGSTTGTVPSDTEIRSLAEISLLNALGTGQSAVKDTEDKIYFTGHGSAVIYGDFIFYGNTYLYRATTLQDTISLQLANKNAGNTYTFAFDLYAGECSFDISQVVRSWFTRSLAPLETYTDPNTNGTLDMAIDKRLFVQYLLILPYTLDDEGVDRYEYFAVNGCVQMGESETILEGAKTLLPEKKYTGYPVEKTILTLTHHALLPLVPSGHFTAPTKVVIRYDNSTAILSSSCVPQAPFYLRWINNIGGVEQWMFERRQTFKPAVKSSSVYEVDVSSVEKERTNEIAYGISTENKVVVGAEDIEESIFNELKKMPFSPEIEWYNEKTGKWLRLVVEKYDTSYNSDSKRHSIEVTFSLPNLYTQF